MNPEKKAVAEPGVEKFFKNRTLMVCSMHGKDLAMRAVIEKYLNVQVDVVSGMNTDVFGTFSGEVERPLDAVDTLRKKILTGLQLSGATLGIGNEGSFGPHPQIPLVPADQEIVMMIDLENNIEIMHVLTTTDTNFSSAEIHTMKEMVEFANNVNFPSHGLVLKQHVEGKMVALEKGIVTWDHLYSTLLNFRKNKSVITAETDMRAYLNPTRMKVIAAATEQLMQKVISPCPVCHWPGFGETDVKRGLECSLCGAPTRLVRSTLSHCAHCHYEQENEVSEKNADPQYCDHCNP